LPEGKPGKTPDELASIQRDTETVFRQGETYWPYIFGFINSISTWGVQFLNKACCN
jgi:hypothetical protein